MKEHLEQALAALDKIEARVKHYLDSGSAIPAAAVSGSQVSPSLADELAELRSAVTDARALFLASLDDHK